MYPPDDSQKNIVLRRSNELIEARYKLTIEEQRLILLLSSLIHPDDEDFKGYEIRVADFVKMFNLEKRGAIYKAIETASKELVGKRIELSEKGVKKYASWLSYAEYVEGSGVVKVEFHKSLKPYLLQLHKSFTQYKLNHVMSFKSSYSIRLYELLKMEVWKAEKNHKNSFEKIFTIEEYRDLLGINKKEYSAFDNFRRRVIEPTVREISDTTDLNIFEVRYIKTGRKITGIHFIVLIRSEAETSAQVAQLQIGQEPKEKPDIHPVVQSLMNYGFTFENAKSYKNKYGVRQIERNIAYMLAEEKSKPILNKAGYLNKAIKDDYGNVLELEEQKKKDQLAQKKAEEEKKRQEEQENERKKAEQREQTKKAINGFFDLPVGLKNHIQEEFLKVLKSEKSYTHLPPKWELLKDKKELLSNEPMLGYAFAKFLVEKRFV
jgi:plasmid replication initiation protein